MLDQLESLDDTTPPAPDAAMLARVLGRAARRRNRNRFTAAGTAVVALALVLGAVAVLRDHGQKLDVITPATSPTTNTSTPTTLAPESTNGTLPNGLQVRMTVAAPAVTIGENIEMAIVVHNDTTERKTIGVGAFQCILNVTAVLRDAAGHVVSDATRGGVGCYDVGRVISPGSSLTLPMELSTEPVVSPGRYELSLERYPLVAQPRWRLRPVAVTVVAPDLTGHIELPTSTYTAGTMVRGTLVVDNGSRAPVHFAFECRSPEPWNIVLAQHGVPFEPFIGGTGCIPYDTPISTLAPGTTRLPFTVAVAYSSCTQDGRPTVAVPRCEPNGRIPILVPGRYEIMFEGSGPLSSLEIAPETISVVAAGTG